MVDVSSLMTRGPKLIHMHPSDLFLTLNVVHRTKNVSCSQSGQVCMCSIILLPMAGTAEELHARVGG